MCLSDDWYRLKYCNVRLFNLAVTTKNKEDLELCESSDVTHTRESCHRCASSQQRDPTSRALVKAAIEPSRRQHSDSTFISAGGRGREGGRSSRGGRGGGRGGGEGRGGGGGEGGRVGRLLDSRRHSPCLTGHQRQLPSVSVSLPASGWRRYTLQHPSTKLKPWPQGSIRDEIAGLEGRWDAHCVVRAGPGHYGLGCTRARRPSECIQLRAISTNTTNALKILAMHAAASAVSSPLFRGGDVSGCLHFFFSKSSLFHFFFSKSLYMFILLTKSTRTQMKLSINEHHLMRSDRFFAHLLSRAKVPDCLAAPSDESSNSESPLRI